MGTNALVGGLPGLLRQLGMSSVPGEKGLTGDDAKSDSAQPGQNDEKDPGEQMVQVPQAPHGSGCNHCNMQVGGMVKAKDLEKAKQQSKQDRMAKTMEHEMAHNRAAGRMADGPPIVNEDGSGEQKVRMPALNKENPQQTIDDAQLVVNGAMAPVDPSGQDYAVAGQAQGIMSQAQAMKGESGEGAEQGESKGQGQPPGQGQQAGRQPGFKTPQLSVEA